MKPLIIKPTEYTPKVLLDPQKNKFEISGESRPENPAKFYQPILDWLDKYYSLRYWKDSSFDTKTEEIVFEFKFEYFNSTSARYILDILEKIGEFHKAKIDIKVKWYYVDELDIKESGEEFLKIMNIPFEIIAVNK